jgi:low temperature requirement protein LtrA
VSGTERTDEAQREVSTLELFFDLVFVFAITQLTAALADDPTPRGAFQVLLVFGVLWWMFGGYVWLTNAVAPDRPLRKFLLLAAIDLVGFAIVFTCMILMRFGL